MAYRLSPPPNDKDVQAITWKQWFYKIIDILAQPTDLTDVTGVLGVANGGTGLSTVPSDNQILLGNGTGYDLKQLLAGTNITFTETGTTLTISASSGGGSSKIYEPVATAGEIVFSETTGDVLMAWGGDYAT